jgi:hypothetical protein
MYTLDQWGDAFDLVVLVHDESGRIDGGAGARNFLIDLFHRFVFLLIFNGMVVEPFV